MRRPSDYALTISTSSALLGCGFPLLGWYSEMAYHQLPVSFASVLALHSHMVVIWLLDAAPLVMGLYGYLLGTALNKLHRRLDARTQSEQKVRALLNNLMNAVVMINETGIIQACNSTACAMFGYAEHELLGQNVKALMPEEIAQQHDRYIRNYVESGQPRAIGQRRELTARRRDGAVFPIELMVGEMASGGDRFFIASLSDITERKNLEAQLFQAQRLESIGQLAAGIAHEINTPIQYVGDNLHALQQNFEDLAAVIGEYRTCLERAAPQHAEEIRETERRYDLNYILEDTPNAIRQSIEGTDRISHIVKAMKDFSHIDRAKVSHVDINAALLNTLTIAKNEYKYVADTRTDFAELPEIECYASDLNQVFLNLIVNAAHAIAEKGSERGLITLATRLLDDAIEIRIGDNGNGIPLAIRDRVFDPFFTTKEVGKGTGQGLSIAHQVIAKHCGRIWFESEEQRGTTFFIRIPRQLQPATR